MGSEFRNMTVYSVASPKKAGEFTIVTCSYEYRGDAIQKTLYAAIGNSGIFGFDEVISDQIVRSIPACSSWTKIWGSVVIWITPALDPGDSPYDVYAKLIDGPGNDPISPTKHDVLVIEPSGLPDPEFRNLTVQSVTSPVESGQNCIVTCRWEYQGPAISKTLYAAIGNQGTWGFDEVLHGSSERSIPESPSWTAMTGYVTIPITAALDPGDSPYDVYCKLTGVGNDPISPTRENILVVSGTTIPDPEFRGLVIAGYDASVEPGGYCLVRVSFQYRGPAGVKTLYGAIGNSGTWGFDEILAESTMINLPESPDWRNINANVSIYIDTTIDPDQSPYDLYTKLTGAGNDPISPVSHNVITVVGQDPVPDAEFRNLSITDYTRSVVQGGFCAVKVEFQYRGPTLSKTLYAAAGNAGAFGFDEIVHGSTNINIQQALDWETKTATVQVPITEAINPDESPYDLYAKLTGAANDVISPTLNNVLTVEGGGYPNPEFQQIRILEVSSPVQIGGTCWVKIRFQYRGPAGIKTFYAAVGNSGTWGFDEILHAEGVINLQPTAEWQDVDSELAIEITEALDPNESPYDVYAKIMGDGNDLITPAKIDALEVIPGTGTGGITGVITNVGPLSFNVADPIEISVSYNAYCDDIVLQSSGWSTRVKIDIDGKSKSIENYHTGRDGSVQGVVLSLGDMPDKVLSGKATLEGKGDEDWQQLYAKTIKVTPPGAGPGEEGIGGLGWALAILLGLIAVAGGGKKKPTGKKKREKVRA